MRPLATHLSPAGGCETLNVTSRSFANRNVTTTTQRRAALDLAPRARDRRGGLVLALRAAAASCAGHRATCCASPLLPGRHDPDRAAIMPLRSAACVYCYRCAPSCGVRFAAAVAAAAAAEQPAAGDGDARHRLPDASAAFCRRAGDGLLPQRVGRALGLLPLPPARGAARGIVLDGSAAAASFVLTTTLTPSHNSSILRQQKAYAQLEHVLTTRTVYLVETQHGCARAARRIA